MSSEPVKRVKRDVIIAIIFGIVLFASLYYLNDPITILDNISVLNSTTTTALGILFTVLAIIYTFESQFENNRAVKILKKQGKYDDISEVFVLSVATIGVIWIFTFTLSITQIYKPFGANITLFFAFLVIVGFLLLILRLYRCFRIFVLLNKAVKAQE
jgi:hypothetical protein